jgi:GH25 family lysozyme M1 (1,4-beta-N-acetylmuramidase)
MGVRAIDVSRWQGSIDWRAVKNDGVAGAWMKVGGADGPGGSLYRDAKFETYSRDCAAVGMPFGTYWFFVPRLGQAVTQARYAVSVGHGTGGLWPMVDAESNPHGLSSADIDAEVSAFCAETKRLTGRESIVYTFSGANVVGYSANAPRHCPIWIANYGTNAPAAHPPAGHNPGVPPAWSHWDIWQFNSTTRVPGVPDNSVDQNVVTDEFWARMAAPTPSQEDIMANGVKLPDIPESGSRVWVPSTDGVGRPRRYEAPFPDGTSALLEAGVIDGVVELTGNAGRWYYNTFIEVAPVVAEWTALSGNLAQTADIKAAIAATVTDALDGIDAPTLPPTFAADVAGAVLAKIGPTVTDAAAAGVDRELDAAGHALAD